MAIIIGTQQGETLDGSPRTVDDQIFGLAGDDTLNGGDGNDLLDAGPETTS